jgi:hypothetical protein
LVNVNCVNATGNGGVETIVSNTLTASTTYYLRVYHSSVGAANGNFNICIFTPLPQCPPLVAPANTSSVCASAGTILSWTAGTNATSYDVYLDLGAGPATTLVSSSQLSLTYNAGALVAGQYSWKVISRNGNGVSIGCTDFSFTIIAKPTITVSPSGPVVICAPATQTLTGTTSAATPSFQWLNNNAPIASATTISYIATSTGSYRLKVTDGVTGCFDTSLAVLVTINLQPTVPTITPAISTICATPQLLTAAAVVPNNPILSQDFNGAVTGWTTVNNSTGGTVANAAWLLYLSSPTFKSNDSTNFILSNSDAQGSGSQTRTILNAPVINLTNYSSCNLNFWHYFRYNGAPDSAIIEVSIDNANWTREAFYVATDGDAVAWLNKNVNLNTYIGQATVYVRFRFTANWGYYWGIDNVNITGNQIISNYTWAPLAGLFTDPAGTIAYTGTPTATVYGKPTSNATYTVTATSIGGCSNTANAIVNVPLPGVSTWTGAINTDWNNVGNWDCAGIPTITSEVVVPAGRPNYPVINTNVEIKKITVDPSTSVTVATGFELKLNGN